jgi:hypothetical protein
MIYVFVWTPMEGMWGHCSMYIERNDASESRYVSWWPANYHEINPILPNDAEPKHYSDDVRIETRSPTRCFQINIGHEHISEMPMVRAWDRWKTINAFMTFSRNCCSTVAHLLRDPGGAEDHSSWEPLTWWGPNDIIDYMHVLNRHFTVCEPLSPPVPPDIT